MTLGSKKNRAYVVTLAGGTLFGVWMKSLVAGFFMVCPLLLLAGLVVAVQHYLSVIVVRGGTE